MKKIYSSFVVLLLILSCKGSSVQPEEDGSFYLEIQVKESSGSVVPNINVSIRSKIHYISSLKKTSALTDIQAATTIRYNLIQKCYVDLSSYDLNGEKKITLVQGQFNAGAYAVFSDLGNSGKNGVFKVKLTATTDSLKKNILFRDSIYAVIIQPDAALSMAGKTDSNGKLRITDKMLFPHLFKLPPIVHTGSDSPEPLGYFTFPDTVTITVSNDNFTKTNSYDKKIKDGPNNYSLIWIPSASKFSSNNSSVKKFVSNTVINKLAEPLTDWKLYQNYPNPFN